MLRVSNEGYPNLTHGPRSVTLNATMLRFKLKIKLNNNNNNPFVMIKLHENNHY